MPHLELPPDPIACAQKCSNWCWAAALEMLCKSQGVSISQEQFVEKIYGRRVGGTLPCLPSGTLENIQRALHGSSGVVGRVRVSLEGICHYGPPTGAAEMVKAVSEKRPFIFGYGGHAYVCYGLSWEEHKGGLLVTELNLIDPLYALMPERPKLTKFSKENDPRGINGTLELIVTKQPLRSTLARALEEGDGSFVWDDETLVLPEGEDQEIVSVTDW